ncbi:hypothetical protein [Mangrovicoccus sp. HB161399]|uniref:hypothetical protein n=1 Tax=Mangrovicoccus sp. HB161399 TaxID=2720392 RepID=UPI001551DEF1|nr:hypothetical protein [Mangrovicoccus sp. HB161399]
MATYASALHTFSVNDLTATFSGLQYLDYMSMLDSSGSAVVPFVDHDGDILYGIDNEFGFYVSDFIGAEAKELDGDFGEGYAGNIYDIDGNTVGLAVHNAPTDVFLSGAPLGTWSMGLGGVTVKASTEHYATMVSVLSDQTYPDDPDALGPLDNDLKLLDLKPNELGVFEMGPLHELYLKEVVTALQGAMDSTDPGLNAVMADLDFDRDGVMDTYRITKAAVQYDADGDGTAEEHLVGAVDLGNDGTIDLQDKVLNGYGGDADIADVLEANESSVTYNIAYGQDYSVTVKDDGKLLYRWGEAVKRPNDIRMEVDIALPEDWTRDEDGNGVADSLEDGSGGYVITKAELVVTHTITNNPNDQIRPEDFENEAATGRLPSYYVVTDPDDAANTLWVSPVDSYDGTGAALPSYFVLDAGGHIDLAAGGTAVYDPAGVLVGYRNEDAEGNAIGTVLRDLSLAALAAAADLDFSTADMEQGLTAAWYTTIDREPFEWSYDVYPDNPYANVYESFRTAEDAAAAGFDEDALVSGPRWRLTPNKFGQDLPGLEIPLEENSEPPFQSDNIKYDTGDLTTTTINLLDWAGDSPLASSAGWMTIAPETLDVDADGIIDAGWSMVNGMYGAGDAVPDGLILSAVTPNGVNLEQDWLDTAIYIKGDQQDAAKLYDMQLLVEYQTAYSFNEDQIGAVQRVTGLDHNVKTVAFEGAGSFLNPVVFATPATMHGQQAATVEFTEITSTGASFYIQEPDGYDGIHNPETVTLLTLEEGAWSLSDGSLLQVGTTVFEGGATDEFHWVSFGTAFEEAPVIMLQVQTDNGVQWDIARVGNVTETGFSYAIQEAEAYTGRHMREIVGWAALDAADAGGVVDWGGVAVQAFDTGKAVSATPTDFAFDAEVGTDPLVAGILASYFGPDTANLRLAGLTDDTVVATAQFVVSEETTLDDETAHLAETVNGFAFEMDGLLTGMAYGADELVFA